MGDVWLDIIIYTNLFSGKQREMEEECREVLSSLSRSASKDSY